MAGTFNPGGLNAPPKSIVNSMSAGGAAGQGTIAVANLVEYGINAILSGALTAATYKELLAVSGPGILDVAFAYTVDATSRTVGIKVIIDGVTVFDAITAAVTAASKGIVALGGFDVTNTCLPDPVCFNSSLSILVKSSLSETDKIGLGCKYKTT